MKADFYTEVYKYRKGNTGGKCGYLRAVSQTRPEATMFPHGRQAMFNAPRVELALPQGSKQPRKIGSQLDGTKGTAKKRRHRFQKERVRDLKKHIWAEILPII